MVTGHRPIKLGGYGPSLIQQRIRAWLRTELLEAVVGRMGVVAVSGMALGVDQWFAEEAIHLCIPLDCYLPFAEQSTRWPRAAQVHYQSLLDRARAIIVVSKGGYSPAAMQRRNESMVDAAQRHLAVYDGSPGGTRNCVEYGKRRGVSWRFFDFAAKIAP